MINKNFIYLLIYAFYNLLMTKYGIGNYSLVQS